MNPEFTARIEELKKSNGQKNPKKVAQVVMICAVYFKLLLGR